MTFLIVSAELVAVLCVVVMKYMKTAIVYMSHHGTTDKVAHTLQEKIGKEQVELFNLADERHPELENADTIIIGGSIHAGKIQHRLQKFCRQHEELLLRKRLGLFLCFMDQAHGQQEFESAYPESLRRHSSANGLFGGEFLFEEMNFVEKLMVRKVAGVKETVHQLDEEAIGRFADALKA